MYVRKPFLVILHDQVLGKLHTDIVKHSPFHRKPSTTALPTGFNISSTLDYFFLHNTPQQHYKRMLG